MSDTKLCYNVREACTALSIGRSTLYELVRAGHFRFIKVGKKSLIARDDLVRFVTERSGGVAA